LDKADKSTLLPLTDYYICQTTQLIFIAKKSSNLSEL